MFPWCVLEMEPPKKATSVVQMEQTWRNILDLTRRTSPSSTLQSMLLTLNTKVCINYQCNQMLFCIVSSMTLQYFHAMLCPWFSYIWVPCFPLVASCIMPQKISNCLFEENYIKLLDFYQLFSLDTSVSFKLTTTKHLYNL